MAVFNNKGEYKWEFENIGGSSRVKITSGEDLRHLSELDQKMWTVLSCPVKGLEIDEKSLAYMDCDADGKIHITDVIKTAAWITGAVSNADLILEGKDSININDFNKEDGVGIKLYNSAKQILCNLCKDTEVISLADVADSTAIFAKTRFNGDGIITEATPEEDELKAVITAAIASVGSVADRSGAAGVDATLIETFYKALADYKAWQDAAVEAPFGDKTDAAIAAYEALDAKVKDFFMRSRLAAFSPDSTAKLDVQTSRIEAISAENLTAKTDEIASYPIARVTGKPEIDLNEAINPAWAAQFETLKSIAIEADTKVLTEAEWATIGGKFAAYKAWKGAKAGAAVEGLGLEKINELLEKNHKDALLALVAADAQLKEESENIDMVDKFLHIFRDYYTLLKNFVTFQDFYEKNKSVNGIFQVGRLIIDQRECRFCMNVADMAKHNTMAAASGMYLIYCDCTTKSKPGKISIVAALTVGDIGNISVGKNAIFYDNKGLDWDAVVTKIIDNPISIAQAFWSPYRRMAVAVENLINKTAADKDKKMMADATAKINAAPTTAPAAAADAKAAPAAQPFDIGKFAGIFAAFGMALGMIGSALTALLGGIMKLNVLQLVGAFIGIILVISGPAMIMAWMKLRRRNIAPLLNANGWAINASASISIPFGETLTDIAKYPKLKLKDPYAKKGIPTWKKWMISILSLAVVIVGLWLGNLFAWAGFDSPLPWFEKEEVVEEVVEETVCTEIASPEAAL